MRGRMELISVPNQYIHTGGPLSNAGKHPPHPISPLNQSVPLSLQIQLPELPTFRSFLNCGGAGSKLERLHSSPPSLFEKEQMDSRLEPSRNVRGRWYVESGSFEAL